MIQSRFNTFFPLLFIICEFIIIYVKFVYVPDPIAGINLPAKKANIGQHAT